MQAAFTTELLFALLRAGLHPDRREEVVWREQPDWQAVYRLATEQGVSAIAWDGVQRLQAEGQIPSSWEVPRGVKLQWVMQVEKIEKRAAVQLQCASELADHFAKHGVRTVVLKGLALAKFYPRPNHRECGDLDCFLNGDYELGNRLAEELGATVERDYYKHSHIRYKQLMVENHQFCTAIRGLKERKLFEQELQKLIAAPSNIHVGTTSLEIPSADFNALFVTAHGMSHFLSEGLKLRHLCDWMVLLRHEGSSIDRTRFYQLTNMMSYTCFAETLTALAVQYLGLNPEGLPVGMDNRHAERVMTDMLWDDSSIYSRGKTRLISRAMLIINRLKSNWKYRLIYRRSMLLDLCIMSFSYLFERRPKLSHKP